MDLSTTIKLFLVFKFYIVHLPRNGHGPIFLIVNFELCIWKTFKNFSNLLDPITGINGPVLFWIVIGSVLVHIIDMFCFAVQIKTNHAYIFMVMRCGQQKSIRTTTPMEWVVPSIASFIRKFRNHGNNVSCEISFPILSCVYLFWTVG